jgi:hypothetical protein
MGFSKDTKEVVAPADHIDTFNSGHFDNIY